MYVNAKQRIRKRDEKVFYIYLCESTRIGKKVKNTQRYVGSVDEKDLLNGDYSFIEERAYRFTEEELEIVINKLNNMAKKE